MKNGNIKVRDPKAGKRKRILFDPYLRHDYKTNGAASIPAGPVHHGPDDRDPDMIHHFRISARLEEERRSNYSPDRGIS